MRNNMNEFTNHITSSINNYHDSDEGIINDLIKSHLNPEGDVDNKDKIIEMIDYIKSKFYSKEYDEDKFNRLIKLSKLLESTVDVDDFVMTNKLWNINREKQLTLFQETFDVEF